MKNACKMSLLARRNSLKTLDARNSYRRLGRGARVSGEALNGIRSKSKSVFSCPKTGGNVWETWLETFIKWKIQQGKKIKDRTIRDYRKHVSQFFKRYPEAIDPEKVENCIRSYFEEDIAAATHNIRLANLRVFFGFLTLPQDVAETYPVPIYSENPLKKIHKRSTDFRIADIKDDFVAKLLKQPDTETFCGLRDKTLLLLQIDTAIRPGEALKLKVDDLRLDESCLNVPVAIAKTGKHRTLPLSTITIAHIGVLLQERGKYNIPTTVPLFCTCRSNPQQIQYDTWYRRFVDYARMAGVKLRPYDLRHYAALAYYENSDHDLIKLQAFMGHKSLEMTNRYAHYAGSDLIDCHAANSPLNGRKKSKGESAVVAA